MSSSKRAATAEAPSGDDERQVDCGPDQAGPSTQRERQKAKRTSAVNLRTSLSKSRTANLRDGSEDTVRDSTRDPPQHEGMIAIGSEYPWAELRFFLPAWLPRLIHKHFSDRLDNRGGLATHNFKHADAIFVYHGMSDEQKKEAEEMSRYGGGEPRHLVYPDWFARVYFSNKTEPIHSDLPCFLDENGRALLVTVPDLVDSSKRPDNKRKLEVMYHLECNGALVVKLRDANTIILPNGHRYLEKPPEQYENLQRYEVDWVFQQTMAAWLARNNPDFEPNASQQRDVDKDGEPLERLAFTHNDRDRLARFLAYAVPRGRGRGSLALYQRLCKRDANDPIYSWASRHSPQAWHEHYKKTHDKKWKDGSVLDTMIDYNVRDGVGYTLFGETERPKRAHAFQAASQASETPDAIEDAMEVDAALG